VQYNGYFSNATVASTSPGGFYVNYCKHRPENMLNYLACNGLKQKPGWLIVLRKRMLCFLQHIHL
jgi:hypothetical protein